MVSLIYLTLYLEFDMEKTIEQLKKRVKELEEENNNMKKLYTSCVIISLYFW